MYSPRAHPIYPSDFYTGGPLGRADYCDPSGLKLMRCPKCAATDLFTEGDHQYCNRCYTRYRDVRDSGVMSPNRYREVLGAYKDFGSSFASIKEQVGHKKNVLVFADNGVDSAFMAIGLLFYIGSGMILDDNPNVLNRNLASEVYEELTGRAGYAKASYRFITGYEDVKSHLRLDLSIHPVIIRRSVQPLRLTDLKEMENNDGRLEWHPAIDSLVSGGGVIIIHSLHSPDFKSQEAKTYLSNQLYIYTHALKPAPKVYMPCYNNIMLK